MNRQPAECGSRATLIGILFILGTALKAGNIKQVGAVLSDPAVMARLAENTGVLRIGCVLNLAMTVSIAAIAVAFCPVICRRPPERVMPLQYRTIDQLRALAPGTTSCGWPGYVNALMAVPEGG